MEWNDKLPKDHVLREAKWIWPMDRLYLVNCYAEFRKDFNLKSVPAKAPFFITADKAYKLYINGRYVCRGPARGFQKSWPYDEVDIAQYLNKGHNWIAVEAYNPGIGTFQYIHQAKAGFLCAASWKDFLLVSDLEWLMRRSPGRAFTNTARYSVQLDFQEFFDARQENNDWVFCPEIKWKNSANYLSGVPGKEDVRTIGSISPFGQPPWETLEPRNIPMLKDTLTAPAKVTMTAQGRNAEGYENWQNVSWGIHDEYKNMKWAEPSIKTSKKQDFMELEIPVSGKGKFTAVALKMPHYVVANLLVDVNGAKGDEIIDFQHVEIMENGIPVMHEPWSACQVAFANRLTLRKGMNSHEFFHIIGFGAFFMLVRNNTVPLKIKISARNTGYPFTMEGKFECSEKTLNDIHAMCRHTQKVCSLDAYVDTPWREQAQWWGDARVQARNTFYLDGDARLLKRGIRNIASQYAPQGLTYGHAPTIAYNCILPDFSLTWILTVWDYYWQTGDISLFNEQWSRIKEVLDYFETPEARSASGLLKHDRRFWLFEDWCTLYKGEVPTFLNLWYVYTLRYIVKMLNVSGMKKEAASVSKKTEVHEKLCMKFLYDRKQKLFIGGLDTKMKPVDNLSVHDQTIALMSGLAPEAHQNMIDKLILPYLKDEKLEVAIPSSFWCTYVIEEMVKYGYAKEALAFIRKKWQPMLKNGTTWETFAWTPTQGHSTTHAWSAHPSSHLVNILGGITQKEAVWKEISFAPYFSEDISQCRVVVPSPAGKIIAEWNRGNGKIKVQLELPEGIIADVLLPGISCIKKGKGKFSWIINQ